MATCDITSNFYRSTTTCDSLTDASYKGTSTNNYYNYTCTIEDYERIIGESLTNINEEIPKYFTVWNCSPLNQKYTTTCNNWPLEDFSFLTSSTSITSTVGNYSIASGYYCYEPKLDKVGVLKAKLKSNLVIQVKTRSELFKSLSQNEQVAVETLREMISETEFRKFMKYGFILVRATSGKVYQIFGRGGHIKIWFKGKLVEEICVRIKDENVPKVDNLIAFKTMIETNEEDFRKLGNLYKMAA